MGQILLGLDIGAASIKGVRLARGFRGLRLLDSFEAMVEVEDNPSSGEDPLSSAQIEALQSLVEGNKIQAGDLVALSLPGDLRITREVRLPFSDPKKLQQTVPYEIEAELPFDLDAVTVDFVPLQKEKSDSSSPVSRETALLVSALPNETLKRYLDALSPLGIDPAWIGSSEATLYTFAKYFLGVQSKKGEDQTQAELLVIDVGAARTSLCAIREGGIRWARSIPMGGNDFTEALQKEFDLSWEEAEIWKRAIGAGGSEDAAYEEKGPEILEAGIERLATEIDKTLRSYQSKSVRGETKTEGPRRIFHLCGGGAALGGLAPLLENVLEMEAVTLDLSPKSPAASIDGMESVQSDIVSQVYAQALGLALQESEGPLMNFRQGAFSFGKESLETRHQLLSIALAGLLVLALIGGDLALHYQKKEGRYQSLKAALRTSYTQVFPKTRNIVNEVEQTRAAIIDLEQSRTFLRLGETSPLLVLNAISNAIPERLKIDVFNLVIDEDKVRIQAQTLSFESVDQIRSGLLKIPLFKEVEVSDAKVMADQSRVRFRIKITVLDRRKRGKNRAS